MKLGKNMGHSMAAGGKAGSVVTAQGCSRALWGCTVGSAGSSVHKAASKVMELFTGRTSNLVWKTPQFFRAKPPSRMV